MARLTDIGRADWRTERYGITSAVCLDEEFYITQGDPGNSDEHLVVLDRDGAEWLHAALSRALLSERVRGDEE